MQFLIFLIAIFVNFINANNGYDYNKEKTEASASSCTKSLVFTQNWTEVSFWWTTGKTCNYALLSSLTRPQVHPESQDGFSNDGQLPMALQLWAPQRQTARILPRLPRSLDKWRAPFQLAKITKAKRRSFAVGRRDVLESKSSHQGQNKRERSKRKCTSTCKRQGKWSQRTRTWRSRTACNTEQCSSDPTLASSRCLHSSFSASTNPTSSGSSDHGQCRMARSRSKIFPRHDAGTRGDTESSREGRENLIESALKGPQQGVKSSWQSSTAVVQHQRGQSITQAELAQASPRLCCELAEAAPSPSKTSRRSTESRCQKPNRS